MSALSSIEDQIVIFFDLLISLGVKVEYLEKRDEFPISLRGAFKRSSLSIDVSKSTQFYSAIKLLEYSNPMSINVINSSYSKTYMKVTDEMVEKFKDLQQYKVPNDPSSAAFAIAYGLVLNQVKIKSYRECLSIEHSDNKIYSLLSEIGADYKFDDDDLLIKPKPLVGFDLDISDCLDLFPVLWLYCMFL